MSFKSIFLKFIPCRIKSRKNSKLVLCLYIFKAFSDETGCPVQCPVQCPVRCPVGLNWIPFSPSVKLFERLFVFVKKQTKNFCFKTLGVYMLAGNYAICRLKAVLKLGR